jgi:hypothetical protein
MGGYRKHSDRSGWNCGHSQDGDYQAMSFSADITKFVIVAKKNPKRTRDAVLLKLFGAVIKDTPVGNPDLWKSKPPPGYVGGRLRGNWQTNIGSPDLSTDSPIDKSGGATIGRVFKELTPSKMEDVIFFTNNLPYAEKVEFEGHSTQSPAGMMRKNVTRFANLINAEARKVNR